MSDPRPIGVFDSGVGGLTVLREIVRRSPHESLTYLGDNARAPYGTRPDAEVRRYSIECLDLLVARDVKALVVACNTSTAVALGEYRRRYDVPVLGVIRPGAQAAALATRTRRVGVIATPATIRSHAYFDAIKEENPAVEVYEHATPALVPLVEAGVLSGDEAVAAVGFRAWPAARAAGCAGRVHPSASALGEDRHAAAWAARTTRCFGRSSRPRSGRGSRSWTARRRRPARSPSCSRSTGWRRPGRPAARPPTPGGQVTTPPRTGPCRRRAASSRPGTWTAFQALVSRLFDGDFPPAEAAAVGADAA